jgi:quinol monooxygenase YgiN
MVSAVRDEPLHDRIGRHTMALTVGVLALVEAKPGKEAEVEAFVKSGQGIVEQEPGTRVWYGFRIDGSTFGIFDAFEDEAARQAHLAGQIPAALAESGPELLAKDPDIRLVDVLAVKGG